MMLGSGFFLGGLFMGRVLDLFDGEVGVEYAGGGLVEVLDWGSVGVACAGFDCFLSAH